MNPQVQMQSDVGNKLGHAGGGLLSLVGTAAGGIGAYHALKATGNTIPLGLAAALGAEYVTSPSGRVGLGPEGKAVYGRGGRVVYLGGKMFEVGGLFGSRGTQGIFGFGQAITGGMGDYFTSSKGMPIADPRNANAFGRFLGLGLGTGFTLYTGYQALSEGGMEALPKFIAQEIFANKHALEASRTVTSAGVSIEKSLLLTGTAGRLLSRFGGMAGGYALSGIGFDIGKTTGELIAGSISDSETLKSIGGTAGALIGTSGGARIGASLFSGASIGGGATAAIAGAAKGGLAVAGLMLASTAVSTAFNGVYASLRTGFQNKRKMRGLDFAGDTAQMYTQRSTTMRQRAVQAMNRSHMNARSAFGQEAQLMHTHRDAFSTYRRL